MGINTSPYQNGDPRIGLGIVQSLTRIGLGFVPIWDFRVSSPNWNGIQNGDPISERGSPNRYGEGFVNIPNRGVPESVWGSFQFGDQHGCQGGTGIVGYHLSMIFWNLVNHVWMVFDRVVAYEQGWLGTCVHTLPMG
jgi:hypothetical protein